MTKTGEPESPEAPIPEQPTLGEMRVVVKVSLWAALIAAGGWISIPLPFIGVPLTLQTFFVLSAGLLEGPLIGALASVLYLTAGLAGLPVFAGGLAGPAIIFKPSAGFALAFPLVGAIGGLAFKRCKSTGRSSLVLAFTFSVLGNILVLYLFGFLGFMLNTKMNPAAAAKLLLTFIPGDLLKCLAASYLASSRWKKRQGLA